MFFGFLILSGHLFSQSVAQEKFTQGEPLKPCCCNRPACGFSAPAAFDLKKSYFDDWTFFADASFTYWYAREDGLYLAENAIFGVNSLNTVAAPETSFLTPEHEYEPGFKVGIGAISGQEWNMRLEYTWYRGISSVNKEAPANNSSFPGLGVWNIDDWFQQVGGSKSLVGTNVDAAWHLGMDIGDFELSRPFYAGCKLVALPFAGIRTMWIRQKVNIAFTQLGAAEVFALLPQPIHSITSSNSWGIGPRMGLETRLLLPYSCRLEASCAGSLLISKYSQLTHKEDGQSIASFSSFRLKQGNYKTVNPIAEMNLGIGWGSYLNDCKNHLDFSASYDVMVFWGQNGIRRMLDNGWSGIGSDAGNLSFHGLTLMGRFDF